MTDEKEYLKFVLGYDLLHDVYDHYELPCDTAYDISDAIITIFEKSKLYHDTSRSLYECLEEWINDNRNIIIDIIKH